MELKEIQVISHEEISLNLLFFVFSVDNGALFGLIVFSLDIWHYYCSNEDEVDMVDFAILIEYYYY
jgi:hypothetical protein